MCDLEPFSKIQSQILFYLMFCIVQVLWKVENSFSLQNSVVFVVPT